MVVCVYYKYTCEYNFHENCGADTSLTSSGAVHGNMEWGSGGTPFGATKTNDGDGGGRHS